ncbi:hypothetical protein NN6n1_06850 [Shinella zoogloeoides]
MHDEIDILQHEIRKRPVQPRKATLFVRQGLKEVHPRSAGEVALAFLKMNFICQTVIAQAHTASIRRRA